MTRYLTIALASFVVIAANVSGADTHRLPGRVDSAATTRRLDLKPADRDDDVTEKTCWIRRGYCCGPTYYYGPTVAYVGPGFYSYYSFPTYSYYWPAYYSVPSFYYYSPPVVSFGVWGPVVRRQPSVDNGEAPQRRDVQRSFDYDGNPPPAERIPPARIDEGATPVHPKLGPAPTETKIAAPASTARKFTYPAYGEDRVAPKDDRTLLIRRAK